MSTVVPAKTRRNNLITLVLLILFSIGLCLLVFWSMQVHARRLKDATYPEQPSTFAPTARLSFIA